jgi:hypothetical protein
MSKICGFCGQEFESNNINKKYCSKKCKQYSCFKRYKENNSQKIKDVKLNWTRKHRHEGIRQEKNISRNKIEICIKNGSIKKPNSCENCNKISKLEAHHYKGYEHPLDVIWLCKDCHLRKHGKIEKLNQEIPY